MGSVNYQASDYASWESAGLKGFGDYAECVEYREQREDYADSLAGGWFYADDDTLTIYSGTFGNDHSPGASHCTEADVYDDRAEYQAEVNRLEALPEEDPDYIETYEVVVGNVGTVYEGSDREEADQEFDDYVSISQTDKASKAYGEDVSMFVRTAVFCDMIREHHGHLGLD